MRGSRTVPRLRRRSRWFLTVAALFVATPLAGCSATTSQCAEADALRQAGHLTEAAAQYGRAAAAGAVRCAEDGTRGVTGLRADAQEALARGRAAEASGKVQAAREAYAAAGRADLDSPQVSAALARVDGAAASSPTAPVPSEPMAPATTAAPATAVAAQLAASPAVTQAPVGPISAAAAGIAFWVAIAALAAVAAVVVTAAWVAAESRQRVEDLELEVLQLKGELASAQEHARDAGAGVGRLEADTELLRSQVVARGPHIASERVRSDHILDVLGALPPEDVVAEHHVPRSDGHQTEGS